MNNERRSVRMLSDNDLQAVCSVTELAKMLGLSRARVYQLQKMGILPKPLYCSRTRRPYYSLELQKECLDIRKTGIGHNGQPIIFNATRKDRSKKPQSSSDPMYKELADILRQMGSNVTRDKVKDAVKAIYPNGLDRQSDQGMVIRDLFIYLKQKL